MNSTVVRRGAVAGMVGGVAMAMWSMLALAASGHGFWTPVNLIAHVVWRGAPLTGAFNLGALVLGLVIHMATSMMIGVGIAAAAHRARVDRLPAATLGMAVGLGVWLVNQYGVWRILDTAAAHRFTPWVFALGHLMFGAVTGAAAVTAARSARQPTAAATPGRPTSHASR